MHPSRVLLVILAVAACAPTVQGPAPTTIASTLPAEAEARSLTFRAERDEAPVQAQCQIVGPGLELSFATPAVVSVPVGPDGRAAVTSASCTSGEVTRSWEGIPGEETRDVLFDFGQSMGEVWFLRSDSSVLYYGRRGQLVTVQGSPAP